jgi:hypothetical protein
MLGKNQWRCFVAVCLALLFSFSPLTAAAAQSVNASVSGMACCRNKAKACCHKRQAHHSNSGSVISAVACASDCGQMAPAISIFAATFSQNSTWVPAITTAGVTRGNHKVPVSAFSSYNLQQRPPPSISLA